MVEIKTVIEPERSLWQSLTERPQMESAGLRDRVWQIMQEVKDSGDTAIRKFNAAFDRNEIEDFVVREEEWAKADDVDPELASAIQLARANIEAFHKKQLEPELVVETMPGVVCSRRPVPIERVGLYIPGGTAPLFSTVLMLAIPAKIAGCSEIVLCTPAGKEGNINPAVLYAARLTGVDKIYKIGGAQAIAAMAFGTETVSPVQKIFGPGNQYVTCAKQLAQEAGVAIDMPAGPSEVAVFADDTSVPAFVAADLLSQAEHGADSQVMLVATNAEIADRVKVELEKQLRVLDRNEFIQASLRGSRIVILSQTSAAFDFLNLYAPEHLIIASENADKLSKEVKNAGSVFLGNLSAESIGDYASGTNHTLPTYGYAKAWSGVSVDSFVKKITFQKISKAGLANIGPAVEILARAEGLEAHANAVTIRLKHNDN